MIFLPWTKSIILHVWLLFMTISHVWLLFMTISHVSIIMKRIRVLLHFCGAIGLYTNAWKFAFAYSWDIPVNIQNKFHISAHPCIILYLLYACACFLVVAHADRLLRGLFQDGNLFPDGNFFGRKNVWVYLKCLWSEN